MSRYTAIARAIIEADIAARKPWSMGATYGATPDDAGLIAEVLEECNFDLALRKHTGFRRKTLQAVRVLRDAKADTPDGILEILRAALGVFGLPEGFAKRTFANDDGTVGEWVLWLGDEDGIEWAAEREGDMWRVLWAERAER